MASTVSKSFMPIGIERSRKIPVQAVDDRVPVIRFHDTLHSGLANYSALFTGFRTGPRERRGSRHAIPFSDLKGSYGHPFSDLKDSPQRATRFGSHGHPFSDLKGSPHRAARFGSYGHPF